VSHADKLAQSAIAKSEDAAAGGGFRRCPEASRERGVTPARRRRPSPGIPPDGRPVWVMGEGIIREVLRAGISLAAPVMVALVATIHVLAPERLRERRFIGGRPPSASQGVDARDKPEHDGEVMEPRPSLLPDGRRWRGAPDEGLPSPRKAAAAPLHLNDQRRALAPLSHPERG